jgi:positive regulator of sigma E activity
MITLLAVVVYLFQLINFLGVLKLYKSVTLPDVDTTILSIFGLSQGAYLAKKAAVATGAQGSVG